LGNKMIDVLDHPGDRLVVELDPGGPVGGMSHRCPVRMCTVTRRSEGQPALRRPNKWLLYVGLHFATDQLKKLRSDLEQFGGSIRIDRLSWHPPHAFLFSV
jgi:hypothetical protein